MKDQFKATRRQLIESMKSLRVQRTALKGLKGVTAKWDSLTKQMDDTQDKIDTLSKALGLPVQERIVTKRDGKFKVKTKPMDKEMHCAQKVGRLNHGSIEIEVYNHTDRPGYFEGKGIVNVVIPEDELPKDVHGNTARVHYFDNAGRIAGTLEVKDGKAVPGTSIPGDYITSK